MDEFENPKVLTFLSAEDLKGFRRDLLATVYNQANTQLLIYQRGKCLKNSLSIKSRKNSLAGVGDEPMPSEDILNDIKLDKELDVLKNIYEVAFKQLTNEITGKTEEDLLLQEINEREQGHQDVLISAIEAQKPNNSKVDVLSRELRENRTIAKQLKAQLKSEKSKTEQLIGDRDKRLEVLRDQLKNAKRINDLECRLVGKWEENRVSQATIMGEIEERSLMKQIVDLHRRMAGEQRLICEVESFRKTQIADLQQQICSWDQKFKDEKANMLAKNFKLSENIADLMKSHEKHSEINDHRKQFVAEYLKEKAEERLLYEEQMFRVECAVRIQAWWRGTMVRRGLGPYRKKSKKGKKSKGKK